MTFPYSSTMKVTGRIGAGPTSSRSVLADLCVFLIVLVSLWALGALEHSLTRIPSAHVLEMGHKFHVVAVDAGPKTTQVVGLKSIWDFSALNNPCGLWHSHLPLAKLKASIAVIKRSSPEPAAILENGHLAHEALEHGLKGKLIIGHVTLLRSHRSGLRSGWNRSVALFNYNGVAS